MQTEFRYTVATENELNQILSGNEVGSSLPWPANHIPASIPMGSTAVIWKQRRPHNVIQPVALVAHEADFKRLCGRFAQLRSALSPLSTWTHLISVRHFERVRSITSESDLGGWEAAWTGLSIAEAQLCSGKAVGELSLPTCTGTESFTVARTRSLWGDIDEDEISRRFDLANGLTKRNGRNASDTRSQKVRDSFKPIWRALTAVLRGGVRSHDRDLAPLVESLLALDDARKIGDKAEAEKFARLLVPIVPEADALLSLPRLAPEHRLAIFDQLIAQQRTAAAHDSPIRQQALAFIAAYIATVAAGGTPTLTLAESLANSWPEITGWAYVIGGVGERVTWTSAFEGLARLVARELARSFTLHEPPTNDFSLDEASVLVDSSLPDPLVHLRIKEDARIAVAVFPGVNMSLPLTEVPKPEIRRPQAPEPVHHYEGPRGNRDLAVMLADLVWPILRPRIEHSIRSADVDNYYDSSLRRRNKPRTTQMNLKKAKD
jgi:hypothetical protein